MIEHLTLETFKDKIMDFETNKDFKGDLPTILDFSADSWCQPCKQLSPILEELSEEYKGKINIYKIDVEMEQELSSAFDIRSVPTILFYSLDGEQKISRGFLPKSRLKSNIKEILKIE